MEIDTDKFNKDIDRAKAKLDELTKDHRVKITAVFDNGSVAKARKMFADLDNAISRDAAQRLKSSPQGSVLGSLNSLFSPHPVSGAPSAQMSSQSGLLGRMISEPGGGGPAATGGQQGGVSPLRQVLESGGPQGGQSSDDYIKQVLTGAGAADQQTTDKIKQVLTGTAPGNVSTEDMIRQVVTGKGPGNTDTTDTVHEKLDEASKAKLIADSGDAGDESGGSFSSMFAGHARSLLSSVAGIFGGGGGIKDAAGKSGGDSGDGFVRDFSAHIIGGIGPLIFGVSAKMALLVPAIGTALAALPALMGVIGLGMGVAMIGGLLAGVIMTSPKLKAQFAGIGTEAKQMFTTIGAPIVPAISAALKQVGPLLKSITPALTGIMKVIAPQIAGIFAGIGPIVKNLVAIMQAAAPAFGPFIEGLEKLVGNILPGLLAVIKPTIPFIRQFGGILGTLGSNLGKMFSAAAPAIGASMTVLGALLGVIGGLLPVLVKLGGIFATALAPVITQFAGVIKSLMPTLITVGHIIASLAGAIIGDLASALGAVATVLIDIAPALSTFAKTLGLVFTTMENAGVFATLGDAVEDLAAPLAKMISALLNGLAPILPPLFTAIGQIAGILAGGLAAAIAAVLPSLTTLATTVLGAIAEVLPAILPALTSFAGAFTTAFVNAVVTLTPALTQLATAAIGALVTLLPVVVPLLLKLAGIFTSGLVTLVGGVASALALIIKAIPPGVIVALVDGFLGVYAAVKLLTGAMTLLDVAMDANPIGLVVIAVAALAAGLYLAWEKSAAFRDAIKDIGKVMLQVGIIIVEVNRDIVNAFLEVIATVLHGLADAFGWVPGLGGKLKAASKSFDDFKGHVNDAFNGSIGSMQSWQRQLSGGQATAGQVTAKISSDFNSQAAAADSAQTGIANVTTAITKNGYWSDEAKDARQQLITDLENAGVKAGAAKTAVDNYSTAVAVNGADSTQAAAARKQLITDILNAGSNANAGKIALADYTTAVQDNGTKSDAAKSARAQLITDLENSGLSAKAANTLVEGLTSSLLKIPKNVSTNVNVSGSGSGGVQITSSGIAASGPGGIKFTAMAEGGKITQGTGPTADDVLIRASKGETVVSAADSRRLAPLFKALGIPGYAGGSLIGMDSFLGTVDPYVAGRQDAAGQAAMEAAVKAALAAAKASVAKAAAAADIGKGGGSATPGLMTVARYVLAHGGNKAAAAGVAGVVAGESGGNPEAEEAGGGGKGLIQWTYPTVASPIADIITGNADKDMANQLVDMMAYIASRGGIASINAAGSPMGSAEVFSRMEAPLVPGSDIRAGSVASVYAALGGAAGTAAATTRTATAAGGRLRAAAGGRVGYAGGLAGYAGGGKVTGAEYLKAWTGSRQPFINTQIDTWTAGEARDTALAGARGLSRALHAHYVLSEASDKAHIAALTGERQVLRDWRTAMADSDSSLSSWIAAAGNTKSLAGNVAAWKKQLASQKAAIAGVSRMLGLTPAEQQAASAASAAAAADDSGDPGGGGTTAAAPLTAASVIAALTGIGPQGGTSGYAQGGMISEPVIGFGASGHGYTFGERGSEMVSPGGGMTLAGIASRLERLISVTAAVPAGVGGSVGGAINGAAASASFRARYPRSN